MNLQNGEYFGIVRQLPDPNDATTYYVRAEIRDAGSDELLERVTLTDRGSRRFSYNWLVNAKKETAYISIMTAVYTDAAFTTPSDSYSQEMQTYLVETRRLGGGGGGNSWLTEKLLRKILREILGEMLPEDVDHKAMLDGVVDRLFKKVERESEKSVEEISEKIAGIDVQPAITVEGKEIDMQPVTAEMNRIAGESEARFAKMADPVRKLIDRVEAVMGSFNDNTASSGEETRTLLEKLSGELTGAVDDIREILSAGAQAQADAVKTKAGERVPREPKEPPQPTKTYGEIIREMRNKS